MQPRKNFHRIGFIDLVSGSSCTYPSTIIQTALVDIRACKPASQALLGSKKVAIPIPKKESRYSKANQAYLLRDSRQTISKQNLYEGVKF